MKIKRFFFTTLFLMSGLSIIPAQVKLAFNPSKGAKYEYQTEMIQNIKQSFMGQEMPIETEMNVTYLMEIREKTTQEAQVQVTYSDVAYIVSSPMMKMGYDSKNPIENPSEMDQILAKMFSNMIGQSFMLLIASDGSVKSVTGMDAISENMIKAVSANGQMALQLGASMRQQFSDDAMKSSFEQSFKIYPANVVKAGDSWNTDYTMTMNNMNTNVKTKYILKDVSRNMATVAAESDIEMSASVEMEGKLTGTQTGTMIVDARTGMPVTSDMSQNIKGAVKTQGIDVQMELVSKAKTSIKEK